MLLVAVLLAQASGGDQIPWGDILKVGVTPVVVVLLLLTGQLYIGKVADRERESERKLWQLAVDAEKARADRAEEDARTCAERVNTLRQANEDKVLPALFAATQAQRDILAAVLDQRGGGA